MAPRLSRLQACGVATLRTATAESKPREAWDLDLAATLRTALAEGTPRLRTAFTESTPREAPWGAAATPRAATADGKPCEALRQALPGPEERQKLYLDANTPWAEGVRVLLQPPGGRSSGGKPQSPGARSSRGREARPLASPEVKPTSPSAPRLGSGRGARSQSGAAPAPPASKWPGRRFRVRVEYFAGAASPEPPQREFSLGRKQQTGASPKLEAAKYARCAAAIQAAVLEHFDGEVPVCIVPVKLAYALEVVVEPEPLVGLAQAGSAGPTQESVSAYSKLESRAWPRVEEVLASLRTHCRLPVSLTVRSVPNVAQDAGSGGPEAAVGASAAEREELEEASFGEDEEAVSHRASEADAGDKLVPLPFAEVRIQHAASGTSVRVQADEAGVAEAMLFPGHFLLGLSTEYGFDELSPSGLRLRGAFEARSAELVARPRCRCGLQLHDQHGRTLGHLLLRVVAGRAAAGHSGYELSLQTDAEGRCSFSLPEGEYKVVGSGLGHVGAQVTKPFEQPIVVRGDVEQHLRHFELALARVRFGVEVRLCVQSGDPVPGCNFSVRTDGEEVASGRTSEDGLATAELLVGRHQLCFEPDAGSPLDKATASLTLEESGSWAPRKVEMKTKMVDVIIFFATADGLPAENCKCTLRHISSASSRRSVTLCGSLRLDSGDVGATTSSLALFEPYQAVIAEGSTLEYEPQAFGFTPRGGSQTIVVKRTLLGRLAERRFALALDATVPDLCLRLPGVADGVRSALLQPQMHVKCNEGPALFNVVAYTGEVVSWQPAMAELTHEAAEAAASFCRELPAGSGPDPCLALEAALKVPELDAVFFIVGDSLQIDDLFAKRVKLAYYRNPKRPRIHAVLVNGVPGRTCWKHLQALSLLSSGSFRHVCLEAADPSPVGLQVQFISEASDGGGGGGTREFEPQGFDF